MPLALLPFLLLIVPILEISVFVLVGREIGLLATLALIVVTAAIGSVLLRIQGFRVLARIREEIDRGRVPGSALGDGAMILAAGILLLTPGFVTDSIGFLLFVPAVRRSIWRFLAARVTVVVAGGLGGQNGADDDRRRRRDDGGVLDLEPGEFSENDRRR